MKKLLNIVTVSTMGLLWALSNDVVGASALEPMPNPLLLNMTLTEFNGLPPDCPAFTTVKTLKLRATLILETPREASRQEKNEEFRKSVFSRIVGVNPENLILTFLYGDKVESLNGQFLEALTRLKKFEIRGLFKITQPQVDSLIAKINGGLKHIKIECSSWSEDEWSDASVHLWKHIIGSACDAESKADAHQRLANAFKSPDASSHALAILQLGLPEDNQYVSWANYRLAGRRGSAAL